MKTITVDNQEFKVDDADYDLLKAKSWHLLPNGYAYFNQGKAKVLMHRFILGATGRIEVDHRNLDKSNNTRANLRICTSTQNKGNTPLRKDNTSGFKGVSMNNGKWAAYIRIDKKKICIGRFTSREDAARAYDKAAKEHFGEFALCNF